jgi:hypothetical protein
LFELVQKACNVAADLIDRFIREALVNSEAERIHVESSLFQELPDQRPDVIHCVIHFRPRREEHRAVRKFCPGDRWACFGYRF